MNNSLRKDAPFVYSYSMATSGLISQQAAILTCSRTLTKCEKGNRRSGYSLVAALAVAVCAHEAQAQSTNISRPGANATCEVGGIQISPNAGYKPAIIWVQQRIAGLNCKGGENLVFFSQSLATSHYVAAKFCDYQRQVLISRDAAHNSYALSCVLVSSS